MELKRLEMRATVTMYDKNWKGDKNAERNTENN